tara:strand:+ start:202 stop:1227 length:1026 start_codon:yes stop_codon:yes gene_type:complete
VIKFFNKNKYNNFIIKSDGASWVLDEIKKELEIIIKKKFKLINQLYTKFLSNQCIFYLNKYDLLKDKFNNNKIGISYFHVDDKQKKKNNSILKILKTNDLVKAIQVTNDSIKNYLIKKGINKNKIFKIPIGIDLRKFHFSTIKEKIENKKKKNLKDFMVVGSFQKDGIGWGDGMLPKRIKGPDIFVKIIKKISKKQKVHVILTGPARGYVKKKLTEAKISFSHYFFNNYKDVIKLYSLIDIYIVSSRVEGGPRSILESMASGVVIFSTKVGQAEEIIKNNINGYLYDTKNIDSIANKAIKIFKDSSKREKILKKAKKTVVNFSYAKTRKKWFNFFNKIKTR